MYANLKKFIYLVFLNFLLIFNSFAEGSSISGDSNLNVVLLLDTSGSMQITDPLKLRNEGVRLFLQFLKDGDKVSIVQFSDSTKVLMQPSFFNKGGLDILSQGLSLMENTGLYTDLYEAINTAKELLSKEPDEEFEKVIVLFSDGKLDPDEKIRTKEEALTKIQNELLPELKDKNIKLYTLSFSDEADKALLESFANTTDALSWFTPNADKIHESFSKLFLAVQKPQIIPISEKGLKIDGQIDEATFYINKRDKKELVIISPEGQKIVKNKMGDNIKWFSGNLFEIITVTKPQEGLWNFLGSISKEDFATVLTKLKLDVKWPTTIYRGEEQLITASIYDNNKVITLPEIIKVVKMTYQITPTDKVSLPILSGELNDNEVDGDARALDGIFSKIINIDTVGEYELLVNVVTPTFERQQRIPFNVKPRLVFLDMYREDDEDLFKINVDSEIEKYKEFKIFLEAKNSSKKISKIPVVQLEDGSKSFTATTDTLMSGLYSIVAVLSGTNDVGIKIQSISKPIEYKKGSVTIKKTKIIEKKEENIVVVKENKEKTLFLEHGCVFLINIIILVLILFFKKGNTKKVTCENVNLKIKDDVLEKIESLEKKSKESEVDTSSLIFLDDDSEEEDQEERENTQDEDVTFVSDISEENLEEDKEEMEKDVTTEDNDETSSDNENLEGSDLEENEEESEIDNKNDKKEKA